METLSPMMRQYFSFKEKHKDHILLFRVGDFFEMFFDDAVLCSKVSQCVFLFKFIIGCICID